jgi:hypothetical protein
MEIILMKRVFLLFVVLICLFASGCKKNENITPEEIKQAVLSSRLNYLNSQNCDFSGKEIEANLEEVVIEKAKREKNFASADVCLKVSYEKAKGEIFYRLDLKKEKDGWVVNSFKNHKRLKVYPSSEPDKDFVIKETENLYNNDYKLSFSEVQSDLEGQTCRVLFDFEASTQVAESYGQISSDFVFSDTTLQWVLDNTNIENQKVKAWHPEGQWRFKDSKYYYKVYISGLDSEGQTMDVKIIASEYESVIDTADYLSVETLPVAWGDEIYSENISLDLAEETINVRLLIKGDGLYFSTNTSPEFEKVNLSRYTSKEY